MNAHHTQSPADNSEDQDLDQLYADWRDDRDGASQRTLTQWLIQAPTMGESLVAWTSEASLLQCAAALPENTGLVALTEQIGRQAIVAYRSRTVPATKPVISIKAAAERCGMNFKTLAATLEIGLPIVAKLEQRLLRVETIPTRMIDRLSEVLQISCDQIRAYLAHPPTLSAAALYKADSAPRAGTQESFAHAIETCAGMTADQKHQWLTVPTEIES